MRTDALLVATVGYLLLPNAVFAVGWLRPAPGYGALLIMLACLAEVARRARTSVPPLGGPTLAFVAALAAFWVAVGGIGEINTQFPDYVKHNLVFHDLAVERWPVVYRAGGGGDPMLCYYLAYYLPTALAAKVTGLVHAAAASLVWGAAGVLLSFAWIARLGRPHGAAVLGLFTLVDGLCWLPGVGFLAHRLATGAGAPVGGWWQTDSFTARFWDLAAPPYRLIFQSEPALLLWTPQHALGAWLATACVLSVLWEGRRPGHAVLVNAAVVLWSPFVAVGLLPFTAAAVWRRGRPDVSWADVAGGAALGVAVGLYLLAHDPQRHLGVLLAGLPDAAAWAKYLLFLLLAIGALWVAVWLVQRRHALLAPAQWAAFRLAGAVLVVSTFVTMGKYNDWAMRVSRPGLFVLHLTVAAVAVALWTSRALVRHRLAFAALVLLASVRAIKMYVLVPGGGLTRSGRQTTIATAREAADGLVNLRDGGDPSVASQYLGSTGSWFGRYLMRRPPTASPGGAAPGGGEEQER